MLFCEQLSKILCKLKDKSDVLDLWAWDGKYSIFCASFWTHVFAIDNGSKPTWKWPKYLINHPNITFEQWDIRALPKSLLIKKYWLIILFNTIVFLKKKLFIENLLPQYLSLLKKNWVICLSFFFDDDETMSKNWCLSFYSFDDFLWNNTYIVENKQEFFIHENHEPEGDHTHHIWYLELKKIN